MFGVIARLGPKIMPLDDLTGMPTRGKILISDHLIAVLAAMILVGSVAATVGIQQVYAPRMCGGCGAFQKIIGEFVTNVVNEVLIAPPDPDKQQKLGQFRQISAQFETDVINAVLVGNPDTKRILDTLLETYQGKILDIRLGLRSLRVQDYLGWR